MSEDESKQPQFASESERALFQQLLFSQLQANDAAARARVAARNDTDGVSASAAATSDNGPVAAYIADDQSNVHTTLCRYCDTKIFLNGAAKYISKELPLHLLSGSKDDATRENLSDYWLLTSQMSFENVAVTKSVEQQPATYRYLACATCDRGPIGINILAEPTKFYVAHSRIKYQQ